MKRLLAILVLTAVPALTACSEGYPLDTAESCADLSDVDISALTPAEASEMGDLVFEFAQMALAAGDNADSLQCQNLLGPLDQVGVILDLEEMDRS